MFGWYARIIQAHVCLHEQRLKVRYSQLYNFRFLRWILSNPLLEPKAQPDVDETPSGPPGDTSPHVTTGRKRQFELTNARVHEGSRSHDCLHRHDSGFSIEAISVRQ